MDRHSSPPTATTPASARRGAVHDDRHPRTWHRRLAAVLAGPLPRLPSGLDALSEGWWRLPPRVRVLAGLVAVLGVLTILGARATASPWGGPVPVLVAAADADPGDEVRTVAARWPAGLVPDDALASSTDGVATRPVRTGQVLTRAHVADDLADLLEPGEIGLVLERTLPDVPVGAELDLLGTDFEGNGHRLGAGRLVAAGDEWTWIAVDRDTAPAVAAALSTGQVTVGLAASQ